MESTNELDSYVHYVIEQAEEAGDEGLKEAAEKIRDRIDSSRATLTISTVKEMQRGLEAKVRRATTTATR